VGHWATREELAKACDEQFGIGKRKTQGARKVLLDEKRIVIREEKRNRQGAAKQLFAPAPELRPSGWGVEGDD
jgi:hypothetical protein